MVNNILPILQTILVFCNIIVLVYGGYKFLNKPHDKLEERVTTLEVDVKEIKQALKQGNDRFKENDDAIKVLIKSTLALIEFEMQYCLVEHKEMSTGLAKAKEDLNEYLSGT